MIIMPLHIFRKGQSGFTLIEALIAFVVMTVGILGALLFHSQILRDSAESKAQIEALKIAEQYIEKQRALAYTNFTGLSTALHSLHSSPPSPVDGNNATYSFTFSEPTLVSGSSSTLSQSLTLEWGDGESTTLSSFYSWVDPRKTLPADGVGDGTGGDYDSTDIPFPTGTLEILAREELAALDQSEYNGESIVKVDGRDVGTYTKDDETFVVIDLGSDKVRVAKLSEATNEIMTISGKIYNNWSGQYQNRPLQLPFGYVYKRDGEDADDNIIDIRATGGAVCVIDDDFVNDDQENPTHGIEATYVCVAGTGWNGTIYLYKKDPTANTLTDFDLQEATDGLVCAPRQRSYRYLLVSVVDSVDPVGDLDTLEAYVEDLSPAASVAQMIFNSNLSQVGQSGIVRFSTNPTGEQVSWENYFWHNPEHLVPPDAVSYAATNLVVLGTDAQDLGYKVPSYTSTAAGSYSVNLPGDIAYQNFILAEETATLVNTETGRDIGGSSSTWDCNDVVSTALSSFASGAYNSDRLDHEYLMDRGMPGYNSAPDDVAEWGFVPVSSGYPSSYTIDYGPDDYNKFTWTDTDTNANREDWSPDSRGSLILGYALATERVGGTLTVPNGFDVLAATFKFGGNPDPVISIDCVPDSDNKTTLAGADVYPFTCSVPANWEGSVVAYDTSSGAGVVSCNSPNDIEIVTSGGNGTSTFDSDTVSVLAQTDMSKAAIFALGVDFGEGVIVPVGNYTFEYVVFADNIVAGTDNSQSIDLDLTCN